MQKTIICAILILNNLIYILLSIKQVKSHKRIIESSLIFEGLISSTLIYIALIIYLLSNNFNHLFYGIIISWIIAYICYYFIKRTK